MPVDRCHMSIPRLMALQPISFAAFSGCEGKQRCWWWHTVSEDDGHRRFSSADRSDDVSGGSVKSVSISRRPTRPDLVNLTIPPSARVQWIPPHWALFLQPQTLSTRLPNLNKENGTIPKRLRGLSRRW